MSGWVKMHRCLMDHWVWGEPEALKFWLTLLMDANHTDQKKLFNGALMEIKRGQILFGLNAYEKKTGISQRKMRRYLDTLQNERMIDRQKTNKFSLITVVNYDEYQSADSQTSSKRHTNDTQTTTPKNVKNDKNVKNTPKRASAKREDLTPYQQIVDCYHSKCTEQNMCNELTPARKKRIKQFWAMINKDGNGSVKIGRYFDYVASNTYLPTKRYADLHWLMQQDRYLEIKEGKFDND